MPSPNQITVAQLSRLIGTPDCPRLIDVCIDQDFADDPRLIPGAMRFPFEKIADLAPELAGQRVVVICQKGKKLSEGVAAYLRTCGVHAEILEGGIYGWRDADQPMVPAATLPSGAMDKGSLWVTRHRPKIDRIACPWLIRRFIDRNARFLFVSPSEVDAVAEKFAATPFDIENTFWSHRGENCTFDTMIEEWKLKTPALERLALVVRAADTDSHHLAPQAAGLLALSVGLSRLYRDDLQQLEAGMTMYDALYRWARDGYDEQHDWPVNS